MARASYAVAITSQSRVSRESCQFGGESSERQCRSSVFAVELKACPQLPAFLRVRHGVAPADGNQLATMALLPCGHFACRLGWFQGLEGVLLARVPLLTPARAATIRAT